jgi:hypothetical protein
VNRGKEMKEEAVPELKKSRSSTASKGKKSAAQKMIDDTVVE